MADQLRVRADAGGAFPGASRHHPAGRRTFATLVAVSRQRKSHRTAILLGQAPVQFYNSQTKNESLVASLWL